MTDPCPYCARECPRCHYPIDGGWVHVEQPQAPESNVVVCNLQRHIGPMADVLGAYLDHARHRLQVVPSAPSQDPSVMRGGPDA